MTWYNSKFSSVSLHSNHPYSMNLTGCVMCQCPSLCPMWSPHPGWRLLWAAHCSQLSPSAGGQSGAACRALQAGPPGGAQHAALQHCPHTTEVLLPGLLCPIQCYDERVFAVTAAGAGRHQWSVVSSLHGDTGRGGNTALLTRDTQSEEVSRDGGRPRRRGCGLRRGAGPRGAARTLPAQDLPLARPRLRSGRPRRRGLCLHRWGSSQIRDEGSA